MTGTCATVIEVTVPKKAKGDLENPQGFIPFIASFEGRTKTTVENYVIRTKSGFALANGKPVAKGTEASFGSALIAQAIMEPALKPTVPLPALT